MAITSWTSEGMVWTLPNLLEAPLEYRWVEAVRLACYERLRAINGATAWIATYWPAIASPVTAGDLPRGNTFGYLGNDIDAAIAYIYTNSIQHTIGNPSGQRYCPVWTQANLLTAMGTATWYYHLPPTTIPGFYSGWLWQCYNAINLCLWIKHLWEFFSVTSNPEAKEALAADWGATGWAPQTGGSGKFIANAINFKWSGGYGRRIRSTGQWHSIDPTLTYDMQALLPVAGLTAFGWGAIDGGYDAQGSGYIQTAWNEIATASAQTAATQTVTIGDDAAYPPNTPAGALKTSGWDGACTNTGHDASGDAAAKKSPILIRKYNVTGGFQFVP